MKKLLGTLGLLTATITPAFASQGVVEVNVREGHRGWSMGSISFSGEAAEDLYWLMQTQVLAMPDFRGDDIKEQSLKRGDDVDCYRTVRYGRELPSVGPQPAMPMPPHPVPPPGFGPGFGPGPLPPVAVQPVCAGPVCRGEDRVSYQCETRINARGKIDIEDMRGERGGRGGRDDRDGRGGRGPGGWH